MSVFGAPPQQVPQQQQVPQYSLNSYMKTPTAYITTLNLAVANDRPDIAKSLLENGADVNERNASGFTPLHLAITKNNPDMVSLLVENGANVNEEQRYGDTPLHLANRKKPEISKLLLAKGADMTSTNRFGDTPLDINPGLAQLNREVQAEQAQQNFEVRKPLIQLSEGLDSQKPRRHHYIENEFAQRDIASYLDRNTKGGKHKRKSRKYRKSKKSKRSRKSRKYRR